MTVKLAARTWPGMQSRIFLDSPWEREDSDTYTARGGYSREPADHADALLNAVRAADLRGRGGAAFPTATKLEAVMRAAPPARPIVVGNGAEGEPFSFKDRYLMRHRPHMVLDGLIGCATFVRADEAILYVCDDASGDRLREALEERQPPLPVSVVVAEHTYVAGEETAVVNRLSGGRSLPTDKPPRPFESGVRGRPTLVLNVDTLAQAACLLLPGIGTSGTRPFFLASAVSIGEEPVLYELPEGVSLTDLADEFAGRRTAFDAVLMGGFFGGITPVSGGIPLQFPNTARSDLALGCASFFFVDREADCPVAAVADVAAYLSRHNARQCGSCMRGTSAAAKALESLCAGEASAAVREDFARWSQVLVGRGACAVPDGLARLLRCLLTEFGPTVEKHLAHRCQRCAELTASGRRRSRFSLDF